MRGQKKKKIMSEEYKVYPVDASGSTVLGSDNGPTSFKGNYKQSDTYKQMRKKANYSPHIHGHIHHWEVKDKKGKTVEKIHNPNYSGPTGVGKLVLKWRKFVRENRIRRGYYGDDIT